MSFIQVELGGGLGNRLFHYSFARAYAERHGCALRTKPHVWQHVFDLPDSLPPIDGEVPRRDTYAFHEWDGETDINITGMAQHQKNLIYTREQVRSWFRLKPELAKLVKNVPSLPLVASLRLGDYCYACNPFAWVDKQSYLDCCGEFGLDTDNLYFLDGEQHYRIPEIPVSKPWVQLSDAEKETSIDFLPDLALMMRARVLLRSNSTFAWWAATLGYCERVFCPDVSKVNPALGIVGGVRVPQLVPFVEGNHTPVCHGYHYLSELHLRES